MSLLTTRSTDPVAATDVARQERLNRTTWLYTYVVCLGLVAIAAAVTLFRSDELFAPAVLLVALGVSTCVARPVWGVYLTVGLAMLGDASIVPSYPITKNFSSSESILYLSDSLSLSPLDLLVGGLVLGWVLRALADRSWTVYRGRLFRSVAVFTGFIVFGLAWGIGTGGSTIVAYWEVRALLYLPVLFLLVTNLFDRPGQYRKLLWLVMVVLTLNAIAALLEYRTLTPDEREALQSLGEHGAAVQWAALIVFTAATWLFRHRGLSGRWVLLLMAFPTGWAMMLSERRAAMVALFVGLAFVLVVLRWHHRIRFWLVFPAAVIVVVAWLGAFWNSTGPLALPAEAAKSVIASDQQSEEDRASDDYRAIEEFNIVSTIRAEPATGVGFGQQFYMFAPLPNISFFPFWQYITHNSILWIWMKTGVGGFVAMLAMFATAIRAGARVLRTSTDGAWTTVTLTSVAYVVMFAVFAYVDIAWDIRNVVFLTVCLAQIDRAAGFSANASVEPAWDTTTERRDHAPAGIEPVR